MRVFTTDELWARKIPTAINFFEVVEALRFSFGNVSAFETQKFFGRPLFFLGAVAVGSVARKHDLACTSDIDIVAFYDDTQVSKKEVVTFFAESKDFYVRALQIANYYNIPVNVYNVFLSMLIENKTRYNKQFLKHVRNVMGGLDSDQPSGLLSGYPRLIEDVINQAHSLTKEQAIQYIVTKKEKMTDGYISFGGLSEERKAKFCAQILNAPFHATRQVFDVRGMHYVDTKQGVLLASTELSLEIADSLELLVALSEDYITQCEKYRDDMTNKEPVPILDAEKAYYHAHRVLSLLDLAV